MLPARRSVIDRRVGAVVFVLFVAAWGLQLSAHRTLRDAAPTRQHDRLPFVDAALQDLVKARQTAANGRPATPSSPPHVALSDTSTVAPVPRRATTAGGAQPVRRVSSDDGLFRWGGPGCAARADAYGPTMDDVLQRRHVEPTGPDAASQSRPPPAAPPSVDDTVDNATDPCDVWTVPFPPHRADACVARLADRRNWASIAVLPPKFEQRTIKFAVTLKPWRRAATAARSRRRCRSRSSRPRRGRRRRRARRRRGRGS